MEVLFEYAGPRLLMLGQLLRVVTNEGQIVDLIIVGIIPHGDHAIIKAATI